MGKVMAFFAIILLFMAMSTALAAATGQSWVNINNRVGGPITAQCASRDDNLSVHVLQNMQQLAWSFDENFFGTTLFWCNFFWQQRTAHVDVWSGGGIWEIGKLCDRCVWDVAPNGFWQSEEGGVGVRWIQGWIYPRQLRTSWRQLMYLIHLQLTEYPGITRESSQDNWKRIPPSLT